MCPTSSLLPAFPTEYRAKPDPQGHQPVITGGFFSRLFRTTLPLSSLDSPRETYRLFLHLGTPRNSNPIGSVAANELEP